MNGSEWFPLRGPIPTAEHKIHQRYSFNDLEGVYTLLNFLRELRSRDHLEDFDASQFKKQRQAALNDLKVITKLAASANRQIQALRNRLRSFSSEYEYHPMLMESIMAVDMGSPSEVVPDALDPFANVNGDPALFDDVEKRLGALAALPVGRPGGPITNTTLQKAVAACRDFWLKEGRSWKSEMLSTALPGDDVLVLQGECERFTADTLGVTAIDFDLADLRKAFSAVTPVKKRPIAK